MANLDTLRDTIVTSFYDNSVMLNTLMNIEYLLSDEVILYPYENWENAEVISGPFVKRYFVTVVFRFDYEEMPNPEAIKVLEKFGIITKYKKVKEQQYGEKKKKDAWYVQLEIPKKLVTDSRQAEKLSQIEDMLDIESIESVADETDNGDNQFDEFDNDNFGSEEFDDIEDTSDNDIGTEEPDDDSK